MPVIKLGHAEPTILHALTRLLPPWVTEFAIVSLFVVLLLSLIAYLGTRRLQAKQPGRGQAFLELVVGGMAGFVEGSLGPHSQRYVPFIGTLAVFIFVMNMFGVIPGFISPTASLNTTISLALVVFVVVQAEGIRVQGLKHYAQHFAGDIWWLWWLMIPLHIIGELAKPLSLALRLAGNVFAEDAVIAIFAALSPTLYLMLKAHWAQDVPLFPLQIIIMPLMLFFGMVQALVFTMLTTIYLSLMVSEQH